MGQHIVVNQVLSGQMPSSAAPEQDNLQTRATAWRSAAVAQFEPPMFELARTGRIYIATTGTATSVASVNAVPTTAAAWALYNGYSTGRGGTVLVPLAASFWGAAGSTHTLGSQLLVGLSPTAQAAAVTTAANAFVKSASASTRVSSATFGTGVTLAGTPAWMAFEGALPTAAAISGGGRSSRLDGMFVVPQGYALGFTVLSQGITGTFGVSVAFAELDALLL